jgi:hypothetical protein
VRRVRRTGGALDEEGHCPLCRLDWLAAEEAAIEASINATSAVVDAVIHGYVDPDDLLDAIVKKLRSEEIAEWAPLRRRIADLSDALRAHKQTMLRR